MLSGANLEAQAATHLASQFSPEAVEPGGLVFQETKWREPNRDQDSGDIVLSRWTASCGSERTEQTVTPADCHVVALALATTQISLWTPSRLLFEGALPSGSILVTTPGQQLKAHVLPPFNFLHLHVRNRFLCEEGLLGHDGDSAAGGDGTPFRDTLAEGLAHSLLDERSIGPRSAEIVAKAIIMRTIGRPKAKSRCRALPKWRMKRLERYLSDSIEKPLTLEDMAEAVGLSKMHFAAQFRAATGARPHEYLLYKRVELAKSVIAKTGMPLVDVAFAIGFNAQAHFSTVFKRFTGRTPVQWKQECVSSTGVRISHQAIGRNT